MPSTILFDNGTHKNVLLPDFGEGAAVQANQHLIIDNGEGMILDPGGHKIYSKVLSETMQQLKGGKLKHIFLSHQDPDIVAAVNGWLMTTDAIAYASALWVRFIPHFGLDRLVVDRLKPIGDAGTFITCGKAQLMVIPAHFLHSPGNFQVYDPVSKILYSGDLGASVGADYFEVTDFDAHLKYIEGFHKRYMAAGRTMKAWAKMIRQLEISVIAPQHGAYFKGPLVERFISWCEQLDCGVDLADGLFQLPKT